MIVFDRKFLLRAEHGMIYFLGNLYILGGATGDNTHDSTYSFIYKNFHVFYLNDIWVMELITKKCWMVPESSYVILR